MTRSREWLNVGEHALAEGTEHEVNDGGEWRVEHRPISRARVEQAIEALEWIEPADELPMSPGLAIRETIASLRLPQVSKIAWRGADGYATTAIHYYTVYGIEANYRDGSARLYVLDRGHDIVPLAVDFTPKQPD